MIEPVEPLMTQAERNSALWRKLRKNLEQRLDTLRAQNDGDKDERATAMLRGRIAEVKTLLTLGDDPLN